MNSTLTKEGGLKDTSTTLVEKLTKLGYVGLFQGEDEAELDALWSENGAPQALSLLAIDPKAPALARFLAAEILFCKDRSYPPRQQKGQLASVYAAALTRNFTGTANPWGLPGILGSLLEEHIEALGEAAVPDLAGLLDDDRRVYYVGSEEATLGNSFEYRVKDLAAFCLFKIKGMPSKMEEDSRKRDKEIEKLKNTLR
jgi:hypothetical protein